MTLRPLIAIAGMTTLAMAAAMPAAAANVDVGVSIQISQPGVYGRIDIGRYPQPQVVYTQPVVVLPPRVVAPRPQPVYMWVPPGHRKNWRQHCGRYGACGTPVVFVRDDWYADHVYPQGKSRGRGRDKGDDHDHGGSHGHGHDR